MYAEPENSEILFKDLQVIDRSAGDIGTARTSYDLSTSLQQLLTAANAPDRSATITVWISERRINFGVQSTDASTRKDLYLTVRYQLDRPDIDGSPRKPLVGTFTSVTTYNISNSPYAEVTALQDARKRAAEDVAGRIARDIAFKTKQ